MRKRALRLLLLGPKGYLWRPYINQLQKGDCITAAADNLKHTGRTAGTHSRSPSVQAALCPASGPSVVKFSRSCPPASEPALFAARPRGFISAPPLPAGWTVPAPHLPAAPATPAPRGCQLSSTVAPIRCNSSAPSRPAVAATAASRRQRSKTAPTPTPTLSNAAATPDSAKKKQRSRRRRGRGGRGNQQATAAPKDTVSKPYGAPSPRATDSSASKFRGQTLRALLPKLRRGSSSWDAAQHADEARLWLENSMRRRPLRRAQERCLAAVTALVALPCADLRMTERGAWEQLLAPMVEVVDAEVAEAEAMEAVRKSPGLAAVDGGGVGAGEGLAEAVAVTESAGSDSTATAPRAKLPAHDPDLSGFYSRPPPAWTAALSLQAAAACGQASESLPQLQHLHLGLRRLVRLRMRRTVGRELHHTLLLLHAAEGMVGWPALPASRPAQPSPPLPSAQPPGEPLAGDAARRAAEKVHRGAQRPRSARAVRREAAVLGDQAAMLDVHTEAMEAGQAAARLLSRRRTSERLLRDLVGLAASKYSHLSAGIRTSTLPAALVLRSVLAAWQGACGPEPQAALGAAAGLQSSDPRIATNQAAAGIEGGGTEAPGGLSSQTGSGGVGVVTAAAVVPQPPPSAVCDEQLLRDVVLAVAACRRQLVAPKVEQRAMKQRDWSLRRANLVASYTALWEAVWASLRRATDLLEGSPGAQPAMPQLCNSTMSAADVLMSTATRLGAESAAPPPSPLLPREQLLALTWELSRLALASLHASGIGKGRGAGSSSRPSPEPGSAGGSGGMVSGPLSQEAQFALLLRAAELLRDPPRRLDKNQAAPSINAVIPHVIDHKGIRSLVSGMAADHSHELASATLRVVETRLQAGALMTKGPLLSASHGGKGAVALSVDATSQTMSGAVLHDPSAVLASSYSERLTSLTQLVCHLARSPSGDWRLLDRMLRRHGEVLESAAAAAARPDTAGAAAERSASVVVERELAVTAGAAEEAAELQTETAGGSPDVEPGVQAAVSDSTGSGGHGIGGQGAEMDGVAAHDAHRRRALAAVAAKVVSSGEAELQATCRRFPEVVMGLADQLAAGLELEGLGEGGLLWKNSGMSAPQVMASEAMAEREKPSPSRTPENLLLLREAVERLLRLSGRSTHQSRRGRRITHKGKSTAANSSSMHGGGLGTDPPGLYAATTLLRALLAAGGTSKLRPRLPTAVQSNRPGLDVDHSVDGFEPGDSSDITGVTQWRAAGEDMEAAGMKEASSVGNGYVSSTEPVAEEPALAAAVRLALSQSEAALLSAVTQVPTSSPSSGGGRPGDGSVLAPAQMAPCPSPRTVSLLLEACATLPAGWVRPTLLDACLAAMAQSTAVSAAPPIRETRKSTGARGHQVEGAYGVVGSMEIGAGAARALRALAELQYIPDTRLLLPTLHAAVAAVVARPDAADATPPSKGTTISHATATVTYNDRRKPHPDGLPLEAHAATTGAAARLAAAAAAVDSHDAAAALREGAVRMLASLERVLETGQKERRRDSRDRLSLPDCAALAAALHRSGLLTVPLLAKLAAHHRLHDPDQHRHQLWYSKAAPHDDAGPAEAAFAQRRGAEHAGAPDTATTAACASTASDAVAACQLLPLAAASIRNIAATGSAATVSGGQAGGAFDALTTVAFPSVFVPASTAYGPAASPASVAERLGSWLAPRLSRQVAALPREQLLEGWRAAAELADMAGSAEAATAEAACVAGAEGSWDAAEDGAGADACAAGRGESVAMVVVDNDPRCGSTAVQREREKRPWLAELREAATARFSETGLEGLLLHQLAALAALLNRPPPQWQSPLQGDSAPSGTLHPPTGPFPSRPSNPTPFDSSVSTIPDPSSNIESAPIAPESSAHTPGKGLWASLWASLASPLRRGPVDRPKGHSSDHRHHGAADTANATPDLPNRCTVTASAAAASADASHPGVSGWTSSAATDPADEPPLAHRELLLAQQQQQQHQAQEHQAQREERQRERAQQQQRQQQKEEQRQQLVALVRQALTARALHHGDPYLLPLPLAAAALRDLAAAGELHACPALAAALLDGTAFRLANPEPTGSDVELEQDSEQEEDAGRGVGFTSSGKGGSGVGTGAGEGGGGDGDEALVQLTEALALGGNDAWVVHCASRGLLDELAAAVQRRLRRRGRGQPPLASGVLGGLRARVFGASDPWVETVGTDREGERDGLSVAQLLAMAAFTERTMTAMTGDRGVASGGSGGTLAPGAPQAMASGTGGGGGTVAAAAVQGSVRLLRVLGRALAGRCEGLPPDQAAAVARIFAAPRVRDTHLLQRLAEDAAGRAAPTVEGGAAGATASVKVQPYTPEQLLALAQAMYGGGVRESQLYAPLARALRGQQAALTAAAAEARGTSETTGTTETRGSGSGGGLAARTLQASVSLLRAVRLHADSEALEQAFVLSMRRRQPTTTTTTTASSSSSSSTSSSE